MRSRNRASYLRVGLIIVGLLVVVGGGYYLGTNQESSNSSPEVAMPVLVTPVPPTMTPLPTLTATPTETPTPVSSVPTATPMAVMPPGGIVYGLSPDVNSVGWVQEDESGNHFGESFMYTGIREGTTNHGAMQFDLSFIPAGSTIFSAELELTGLADQGLTSDGSFAVHILSQEVDSAWSRHDFGIIHNAAISETLRPNLEAADLAKGRTNKFVFNAAQRSIIEDRLETHFISFRVDSLTPEGWFGWDSGYGSESLGQGPILRLGVLLPVESEIAGVPPGSTPTPTATFVLITSTPTPENFQTAAAIAPALTAAATTTGTPTPLPENWVTPLVVENTPTPENAATAEFVWAEATAAVIALGTSTPTPQNMVTATPEPTDTPTPIFIAFDGELPPMTPRPTRPAELEPTPPIPEVLIGKIAFKSNRTGKEELYIINPDGTGLALLTNPWPYNMANLADTFSPDGRFRVFTKDSIVYRQVGNGDQTDVTKNAVPTLFWRDALYNIEEQVTHFASGIAYGGVWSPTTDQIAFVSNSTSDDEIWVMNYDGSNQIHITETNESFNGREIGKDTFIPEINKHPSWSPDGKQLVFWSNRTGHGQIWVANADGTNLFSLSRTGFDDYDPVWIKYPGLPPKALEKHAPYIGPFDHVSPTNGCADFDPAAPPNESAQSFYWSVGGPARDPYGLDANNDGLACN